MRRDIKNKEMNSTQLWILSCQVCQWWNAVFVQADRFFDALERNHGGTPWDNGNANSMFVADRMFLIVALYHAIENLEKLDVECQRTGDNSFKPILQAIEVVAPLENIKNLRDMNEHNLDYLVEMGQKQSEFRTAINKNGSEVLTTAAWTHIDHDAKSIFIGNVEIDKVIAVMKQQLPVVQAKTKAQFDHELLGEQN